MGKSPTLSSSSALLVEPIPINRTSWPDSTPDETQPFVSIICGNSTLTWAFHNTLEEKCCPTVYWRTAHLNPQLFKRDDGSAKDKTGLAVEFRKHIPPIVDAHVFGAQTTVQSITPTTKHPPLAVYIVSSCSDETQRIAKLFSSIPSRVYLMKGEDFFSVAEGLQDNYGVDRLAGLRGAGDMYGFPALVFDCGTAMTYTCADMHGRIVGGGIAPGLRSQFRSLGDHTDALPLISPDDVRARVRDAVENDKPLPVFAKETKEAMMVSVLHGLITKTQTIINCWLHVATLSEKENERVNGKNSALKESNSSDKVNTPRCFVCTGGDSEILHDLYKTDTIFSPHLKQDTLKNGSKSKLSDALVQHEKYLLHYGIAFVIRRQLVARIEAVKFIGKRVAKLFEGQGEDGDDVFRGRIISLHKSDKNDEGDDGQNKYEELYKIKYDDGDIEDVSKDELPALLALYEQVGEKKPGNDKGKKMTAKRSYGKKIEQSPAAINSNKRKSNKAAPPARKLASPTRKAAVSMLSNNDPSASQNETPSNKRKFSSDGKSEGKLAKKKVENIRKSPGRPKRNNTKFTEKPESLVNTSVAKSFENVLYHGKITKYIPPEDKNSNKKFSPALWHVVYDDGDEEDFDADDLAEGINLHKSKGTFQKN